MSTPLVMRKSGVIGIGKEIALSVSAQYCKANGYSMEKLKSKRLFVFEDEAVFAEPSGEAVNGLVNDLATRPIPVLILRSKNGNIIFQKTEHTDRYLR